MGMVIFAQPDEVNTGMSSNAENNGKYEAEVVSIRELGVTCRVTGITGGFAMLPNIMVSAALAAAGRPFKEGERFELTLSAPAGGGEEVEAFDVTHRAARLVGDVMTAGQPLGTSGAQ